MEKKQEQKHEISKFADDWGGVDEEILSKASQQYSVNNVSYVPYSEELLDSVNPPGLPI